METYQNAGPGLRKMFIAEVGAIVCTVLMFIPIVNLLAAIGALVFMIISLVGLNAAGKDIEGCKTAFIFTIVNLVINVLSSFLKNVAVIGTILSIAQSIISLLVIYYVCTSVSDVMNKTGHADVAQQGNTVWKINLVCYIVEIAITILALIPVLGVLAVITSAVVGIVSLVAGILYMIFLNKSAQALGA